MCRTCTALMASYMYSPWPQEKRQLLRQWLANSKNLETTETSLVVERQRSTEMKSGWEELTVADMVQRGFSKLLASNYMFCLGGPCYGVWVFKRGRKSNRSFAVEATKIQMLRSAWRPSLTGAARSQAWMRKRLSPRKRPPTSK